MTFALRSRLLISIVVLLAAGCGAPARDDGQLYARAAAEAVERFPHRSMQEKLFADDCGSEVTCLNLYHTQDPELVQTVALALMKVQARRVRPGVVLTVYASPHGQDKVVYRQVTIK